MTTTQTHAAPEKLRKFQIRGTFKLLSPLSQIGTSKKSSAKGPPQSLLATDPVIYENTNVCVPRFSGAGFRSKLRHHAAEYVLGSKQLSLRALHVLFNGGPFGGKSVSPVQVQEIRQKHPVLFLFGGCLGATMIPGTTEASILYPICRETVAIGMVKSETPHDHLPPAESLIMFVPGTRKDMKYEHFAKNRLTDQGVKEMLVELDDAGARRAKVKEEIKKAEKTENGKFTINDEEVGERAGIQMRFQSQAIAPGTELWSRLTWTGPISHLGIMIKAFQGLATEGRLGGMAARGFGKFSAKLSLADMTDLPFRIRELDAPNNPFLRLDEEGLLTINTDIPEVAEALKAADELIARISAEDLEV